MATKLASVAFNGVGDLTVNAKLRPLLRLDGVGDLSTAATAVRSRSVSVDGIGDLAVTPTRVRSRRATYQGVGDLTATSHRVRSSSAALDAAGDLEVSARAILVASAQHIHRADAEYALQQRTDATLSLGRTVEGAVYEEGRERRLGRRDEET